MHHQLGAEFTFLNVKDSYHHARYECQWYDTKYQDKGDPVADNARFLVELDRERKKRWNVPLIVVGGYL